MSEWRIWNIECSTYHLWTCQVVNIFEAGSIDIDFDSHGPQHSSWSGDTGSSLQRTGSAEKSLCSPHMWSLRNGLHCSCLHILYMEWSQSGLWTQIKKYIWLVT